MLKRIKNLFVKEQNNSTPLSKDREEQINPFKVSIKDVQLDGWFNRETACIVKDFKILAEDIVLDAGCGDGGIANFCGQRGAHIILSDIDPQKVNEAEERVKKTAARKVEAHISDSTPLPIADETATVVISTEVIEHVENPEAFLAELVRVGKPGARYMITAPDPASEKLQLNIAPPDYFQTPNHIRILERDEFEALITNAGLIVEDRVYKSAYWTIWWMFFWACGQPELNSPWHPLLDNWAKTWNTLLDLPDGIKVKGAMDELIPKSQVILARKP